MKQQKYNLDILLFFGIIHFDKNYGFLEQIGYFYYKKKRKDRKNININYRSIFNILKYFYIQSNNNTLEKIVLIDSYFIKKKIF